MDLSAVDDGVTKEDVVTSVEYQEVVLHKSRGEKDHEDETLEFD